MKIKYVITLFFSYLLYALLIIYYNCLFYTYSYALEDIYYLQKSSNLGVFQDMHQKLAQIEKEVTHNLKKPNGKKYNLYENNIALAAVTIWNKKSNEISSYYVERVNNQETQNKEVICFESSRDDSTLDSFGKNVTSYLKDHKIQPILQDLHLKYKDPIEWTNWLINTIKYSNFLRAKLDKTSIELLHKKNDSDSLINSLNAQIDSINQNNQKMKMEHQNVRFASQNLKEKSAGTTYAPPTTLLQINLEDAKSYLIQYMKIEKDLQQYVVENIYLKYWHSEQRLLYFLLNTLVNYTRKKYPVELPNELRLHIKDSYFDWRTIFDKIGRYPKDTIIAINLHTRLGPCHICSKTLSYLLDILIKQLNLPRKDNNVVCITVSYSIPFRKEVRQKDSTINELNKNVLAKNHILEKLNNLHTWWDRGIKDPSRKDGSLGKLEGFNTKFKSFQDFLEAKKANIDNINTLKEFIAQVSQLISSPLKQTREYLEHRQGIIDISKLKKYLENACNMLKVINISEIRGIINGIEVKQILDNTPSKKRKNINLLALQHNLDKLVEFTEIINSINFILNTECKEIEKKQKNLNYGKSKGIIDSPQWDNPDFENAIYISQVKTTILDGTSNRDEPDNTIDDENTYWVEDKTRPKQTT